MAETHLAPDRLVALVSTPDEAAHLASCPPCRSERRWRGPAREVLGGRYAVVGWLGAGGMSRVDAAVDRATGRRVAVKRTFAHDGGARRALLREAGTQARVEHPNVLPVLDAFELPDGVALVLPLVEGPTLHGWAATAPPLADRLALFRQVVEGVAAVHRVGLVHRDLKPTNVLLDPAGARVVARVADFGLARSTAADRSALTRPGVGLGTPGYAAPEQRADAARADARSDVWSLGALLRALVGSGDPTWAGLADTLTAEAPSDRPADAGAVLALLPPTGAPDPALVGPCRALAPEVRDLGGDESPRPLPPEPDAFVGRSEALRALAERLAAHRLVVVVGAPGVGKTRLARRYASLWLDDHPGGTWFCDLTEARDAEAVTASLAAALEVPMRPGDAVGQLGRALSARGRCLVVLDNFERVARVAGPTVAAWLAAAPEARLLVTSREPLLLPEAHACPLPVLSAAEGEALFRRRAAEVQPRLSFPPAEEAAIRGLVELLDGLPLALELAAARVRVMAPSAILARMGDRFRVLAVPGSGHHATLRAALDWSWDLCGPEEQGDLGAVAELRGPFGEDAAEALLGPGARDRVDRLVARSLVEPPRDGRWRLLASVREHATERRSDATAAEARLRHGRWFAARGAPEALRALHGPAGAELARALVRDREDLVHATRRAIERGDASTAAAAALASAEALRGVGPAAVARALLSAVLALPDPPREVELRLALVLFLQLDARPAALEAAAAALEAARRHGDRRGVGAALRRLASLVSDTAPDEAQAHLRGSVEALEGVGDGVEEGLAWGTLALFLRDRGRSEEARAAGLRAWELATASGDAAAEGMALNILSTVHRMRGELEEATALAERSLRRHREVGDRWREGTALLTLGSLALDRSELERARAWLGEALDRFRGVGDRVHEGIALGNLAAAEHRAGRLEVAVDLLGRAAALHRETGVRSSLAEVHFNLGSVLQDQGALAEAEACWLEGVAVAREAHYPVLLGILLGKLGALRLSSGGPGAARPLVDEGEQALRAVGDPTWLAHHLALRSRMEREDGALDAADRALAEAEALAARVGAPPGSPLWRTLEKARRS